MRALVIGASGFLGGHLVKELLQQHHQVEILVRASSNIDRLKGLSIKQHIGDVSDIESLKLAMANVDVVFHSAVDTRAWLTDTGPLYRTNVLGVMNSIKAAKACNISKFVLTSSLVTIGKNPQGIADESNELKDADKFTDYIITRHAAENAVLEASRDSQFPGIACCVANTYGPEDTQPTPHGNLIKQVALGTMPFYLAASSEVVGVIDAVKGMILAAEKGRNGERYILSERFISNEDLFKLAAGFANKKIPLIKLPKFLLNVGVMISELTCRVINIDSILTKNSVKLMYQTWPMSHQKAKDELGWQPRPIEDSIKEAVDDYLNS